MVNRKPTNEEIRSALSGVLRSLTFAQAERHKRFLRCVVDETLADARRALDLDGNSCFAHLAMMQVRFPMGDISRFEESAARLLDLRLADPVSLSTISAFWILIGKVADGRALWERALELSRRPLGTMYLPDWFVASMIQA
jgi:hypothetical protein